MASSFKIPTPEELERLIENRRQTKEKEMEKTANEFCKLLFENIEKTCQKEPSKYTTSIWILTDSVKNCEKLLRSVRKILQSTWNLNYKWVESDDDEEDIDIVNTYLEEKLYSIFELNCKSTKLHLYDLELQPFKLKYFFLDECIFCYEPITKTSNMPYFKACGRVYVCHRQKCRERFQKLDKCPMCRTESEIVFTKKIKIKKRHSN